MRKFYPVVAVFWLVCLFIGTIACHQEPAIPSSAIPVTCQVYSIVNVNEAVHDTTYYQYNTFGSVEEIVYRQWVNDRLTNSTKQKFVYSADHYLTTLSEQRISYTSTGIQTQESKTYTYTYQEGQVQQVTITNAQSGQAVGFWLYTYEMGKVKTYVETDAQKSAIRTFTFNAAGILSLATELNADIQLTNGKVTKKALKDGTVTIFQYDNQGQLQSEKLTTATTQTERNFTYDNRPHWNKTQLLFRGIPLLDLGGHTSVHNVITSNLRQSENGRIIRDQSFNYQYQYNKANYSTGYSRSDGIRQRIFYANCQ
ncbi:hypothetical protein GCM10027592_17530 [Spirosoma flavus]